MELPSDEVIEALTRRYADLLARLGGEIGDRPLVLPNGTFFPDAFTPDEAGATRLVRRMQTHAGLLDIPVVTRLLGDDAEAATASSCSSGACAAPLPSSASTPRLVDDGQQWIINVPAAELGAPVVLTTMTARALGRIFLMETSVGDIAEPVDVTADLAAVALGFGPLLLQGAYIYSKSCGGPQVGRVTHLGLPELSVVTALFMAMGGHAVRSATKELDTTQRAMLGEAMDWAGSNRSLVARLAEDPAGVARGRLDLQEAKPWLLRMFGGGKKRSTELPDDFSISDLEALAGTLPQAKAAPRKARDPKEDELAKLVADALNDAPADAE